MNISKNVLSQYISLSHDPIELRHLLDDVGIEVKRVRQESNDIIFGLELLANRGDHYCYQGIAREIHGRTGASLCGPQVETLTTGQSPLPLRLETEKCFTYTATLLTRHGDELSFPDAILAPLEAAGIHTISSAIDATNLSNIELGQPTHVFDADTIIGGITIRESREGERAWPLFADNDIELPVGTMVIADDEKILAIAGVIGCEESKATQDSRRIILESASFDPVSVRIAARKIGIHTDSVARFERGSDPNYPLVGAGRVVHLLEKYAGFSREGTSGLVGEGVKPHAPIRLSYKRLIHFLGVELAPEKIEERLSRYGFELSPYLDGCWDVQIPSVRHWDISTEACLFEVMAISIGYNNTPISLPQIDMGAEPSLTENIQVQVEELFLSHGFYEVFTDGFYSRQDRARLSIEEDSPLFQHVETLNAIDRGYSLLKNNALVHALDAVVRNKNQGQQQIMMYEWTRCFQPDPNAENGVCRERKLLWAMANGRFLPSNWSDSGRLIDPLFFKGLVQELGILLRHEFRLAPLDPEEPLAELLHPGRSASIWLHNTRVGVLGEVHPNVRSRLKLKKNRPCYFEIELDALLQAPEGQRYTLPPIHQPLVRTLAFALPPRIEADAVGHLLGQEGASVSIVDEFCYEDSDRMMRAITFELSYPNSNGNLSTETVNASLQTLIQLVETNLGEQGVHQR
ncbi:MAG: phenylalanine--tRNA ligase beta subunit-related protein [Myxococcota bacterium]